MKSTVYYGVLSRARFLIAGTILNYDIFFWSQGTRSIYVDVNIYYDYATRAVHGDVPYRDYP